MPTNIRQYGFSPFLGDESTARAEAVVADIAQRFSGMLDQLEGLAGYRHAYWLDLKTFAEGQATAILRSLEDGDVEADDAVKQIAGLAADLALRMATKFMLAQAEIYVFGSLVGAPPALETERILDL